MKYFWIFFILNSCIKSVTAQSREVTPYQNKWALRVNPLGLVDIFDGNISGGIAFELNNRWSLCADLSYIFYSVYLSRNRGTSGYIFKPAVRYYLSDKRKFFIEPTVFYKRSSYKIKDWLGKDCVNGVPTYEEYKVFHFRKKVIGFNLQAGVQKSLLKSQLLRVEMYAGIGIRFKWQDIKNDPMACYQPDRNLLGTTVFDPYYVSASIPHGLRLVYVIR